MADARQKALEMAKMLGAQLGKQAPKQTPQQQWPVSNPAAAAPPVSGSSGGGLTYKERFGALKSGLGGDQPSQGASGLGVSSGGGGGGGGSVAAGSLQKRVFLPEDMATELKGEIIGHGGANVKSMQEKSGARIQVRGQGSGSGKMPDVDDHLPLHVFITASSFEALESADALIKGVIETKKQAMGKGVPPVPGQYARMTLACDADDIVHIDDRKVGLIIGKQGATITQLQQKTHCSVQIDKPLPGKSERAIFLKGSKEEIEAAKAEIQALLETSVESGGPGGGAGGGGGGSRQGSRSGLGYGAGGGAGGGDRLESQILQSQVGLFVGRRGANIQRLQDQYGVHIDLSPENMMAPGQVMRPLTITGPLDACKRCEADFRGQLANSDRGAGGGGGGGDRSGQSGGHFGSGGPGGGAQRLLMVPPDCAGVIIGKGGSCIRQIQDRSGCHVHLHPDERRPEGRAVEIRGPTLRDCIIAEQQIFRVCEEKAMKSGRPFVIGGGAYCPADPGPPGMVHQQILMGGGLGGPPGSFPGIPPAGMPPPSGAGYYGVPPPNAGGASSDARDFLSGLGGSGSAADATAGAGAQHVGGVNASASASAGVNAASASVASGEDAQAAAYAKYQQEYAAYAAQCTALGMIPDPPAQLPPMSGGAGATSAAPAPVVSSGGPPTSASLPASVSASAAEDGEIVEDGEIPEEPASKRQRR